jgi:hypothetical protein
VLVVHSSVLVVMVGLTALLVHLFSVVAVAVAHRLYLVLLVVLVVVVRATQLEQRVLEHQTQVAVAVVQVVTLAHHQATAVRVL